MQRVCLAVLRNIGSYGKESTAVTCTYLQQSIRLFINIDELKGGNRVIHKLMKNWHLHLQGEFPGGLDELLADDVEFHSPIVFTPQKGKAITKMYLGAAGNTFSDNADPSEKKLQDLESSSSKFKYVKEVLAGNHAVLEFEAEVDGKYVNGVDIITCNDEGKITEFKVMVRPLQGVNVMHEQMKAMLEKMQKR